MRLGSEKRRGGGPPRQAGRHRAGRNRRPRVCRSVTSEGRTPRNQGSQNPRHPVESPPLTYQLIRICPSCQNSLDFRKFPCSKPQLPAGSVNSITVITRCNYPTFTCCVFAYSGAKVTHASLYGAPAFGNARRHTSAGPPKPGARPCQPTIVCALLSRRQSPGLLRK